MNPPVRHAYPLEYRPSRHIDRYEQLFREPIPREPTFRYSAFRDPMIRDYEYGMAGRYYQPGYRY